MGKAHSPAVISPQGADQTSLSVAIWCLHYECYKHLQVCGRCRIRIKCRSYLDYWSPRFDF